MLIIPAINLENPSNEVNKIFEFITTESEDFKLDGRE